MTQAVTPSSIHNAQLLDRLRAVTKAAETLARHGFVLIGVEIGPRNPVVWVEHTQACETLTGALIVRCPTYTVVAAVLDGVEVRWQQRRLAS
jgi:hypothetical protein